MPKEKPPTEIKLGQFAAWVFEHSTAKERNAARGQDYGTDSHWDKITERAKPHVKALLALAPELGYIITDMPVNGKMPKTDMEKIAEVQWRTWGTTLDLLKEGDRFWPTTDIFDLECYPEETEPYTVDSIDEKKKVMYISIDRDRIEKIGTQGKIKVIKAPEDFEDEDERYTWEEGRAFWRAKAKELGIE